jgi:hypothetical protein
MVFHEESDRKMLEEMPKDRLLDLFVLHIRNVWRVDGLYFLGIEERFGISGRYWGWTKSTRSPSSTC